MGFQGAPGTSNKEIKAYLHKNVGDFRPNWESLYFDLLGFGEMGGLMGAISKKAAVKSLAKGGKSWLKTVEEEFPFALDLAKKTIGKFIRGTRRLPQEILDPLEKVEFKSMGTVKGRVNIPKATLQLNPTTLPKKVYNTLGHEVAHIDDLKALFRKESKTIKRGILERNPSISRTKDQAEDLAYGIMEEVGSLISKNKLDYSSLKRIIGEYTASKNPQELGSLVKELGGEIFKSAGAFEMRGGRDILAEAMNPGVKNFSKKAFQLGREINRGDVSREVVEGAFKTLKEKMVKMPRGTLEEISKFGELASGPHQYLNEALEFADTLSGKSTHKIGIYKQLGELPKDF